MSFFRRLAGAERLFDLAAGLGDGILTALTLAGGKLLGAEAGVSVDLAVRVALAAAVSGGFIFFVAHYAVLRGQLVEAERQLNLTEHGRLVTSRLGQRALQEAAGKALMTACYSFTGALGPLMLGVLWPILAVAAALFGLTLLGMLLAHVAHGRPINWATGLFVGGLAVATIGYFLNIT